MAPLGLTIWTVVTAGLNAFVPVEAEPAEISKCLALGLRGRTGGIGIFDAEYEDSATAARQQPIE